MNGREAEVARSHYRPREIIAKLRKAALSGLIESIRVDDELVKIERRLPQ